MPTGGFSHGTSPLLQPRARVTDTHRLGVRVLECPARSVRGAGSECASNVRLRGVLYRAGYVRAEPEVFTDDV